jgi:alanine-synthesizing transaminase
LAAYAFRAIAAIMPGFFSDESLQENRVEVACASRRARGLPLLDLTNTNPTENGFLFPADILLRESRRYFESRRYRPHPKGLLEAREAIAHYYAHRTPPLHLSPENIVLTASTSESYSLLFSLLCEPGDNVLAPNLTYPLFELLASHHRVKLAAYEMGAEPSWHIDEVSFGRVANKSTRAALIISPHNPTGMILKTPLGEVSRLRLPLICDEVFAEFTAHGISAPPIGSIHDDVPVFHLHGISKMLALPDLKLGWIAMNEAAADSYGERLELLNDTFLSANTLAQSILPQLMHDGFVFAKQMQETVRCRIKTALAALRECPAISVTEPEGGYALFPLLERVDDEEEFVLRLIDRGVLVHPGYFYGNRGPARIMISCLVQEDRLKEGLTHLVALLSSEVTNKSAL